MTLRATWLVVAWLVMSMTRTLDAQTNPCLPADSASAYSTALVRLWVSSASHSDALRARAHYGLPLADPATVVQVQDSTVCARAAVAYNAALDSLDVVERVIVLHVGSLYVVTEGRQPGVPMRRYVAMDTTYAYISRWGK